MARIIQVRDVPDDVYAALADRARISGMSLSEYLRVEMARLSARPSLDEWRARVSAMEPVHSPWPSDELVRRARQTT